MVGKAWQAVEQAGDDFAMTPRVGRMTGGGVGGG